MVDGQGRARRFEEENRTLRSQLESAKGANTVVERFRNEMETLRLRCMEYENEARNLRQTTADLRNQMQSLQMEKAQLTAKVSSVSNNQNETNNLRHQVRPFSPFTARDGCSPVVFCVAVNDERSRGGRRKYGQGQPQLAGFATASGGRAKTARGVQGLLDVVKRPSRLARTLWPKNQRLPCFNADFAYGVTIVGEDETALAASGRKYWYRIQARRHAPIRVRGFFVEAQVRTVAGAAATGGGPVRSIDGAANRGGIECGQSTRSW